MKPSNNPTARLIAAILLAGIAVILLASCGTVRKSSSSLSTRYDSTAATSTAKQAEKITVETVDTVVQAPADSLKADVQLSKGDSTQPDTTHTHEIESGGQKIDLAFNPKTGKLTVKARTKPAPIPVKFNRTITERSAEQTSHTASVSARQEQKATETHREPPSLPWYLKPMRWLALIGLLALLYLAWRYRPTLTNFISKMRRR